MPPPADLSDLLRAELEARFVALLSEVSELKQIVAAQRDEIARLKGLKGRPSIKPSGMEDATGPKRGGKRVKRRRRGKVTPRVTPETRCCAWRIRAVRSSKVMSRTKCRSWC